VGLYKTALHTSHPLPAAQANTLRTLSFTVITMVTALSLIAHKEVRFIYPLLPILHVLGAPSIAAFFTTTSTTTTTTTNGTSDGPRIRHKLFLTSLLSINLVLALYLSLWHQPAPLSVLAFLRTEYERLHPDSLAILPPPNSTNTTTNTTELFALFLTPCHSTPWRSHLIYPSLRARALTCEPPLHTAPNTAERATYLDEADRFYRRPDGGDDGDDDDAAGMYGVAFLRDEMWGPQEQEQQQEDAGGGSGGDDDGVVGKGKRRRAAGEVPRYIVGFEGVEPVLLAFFGGPGEEGEGKKRAPGRDLGVGLARVWEGWNGLFNEDWRRRGKMVVWDTGVYSAAGGER